MNLENNFRWMGHLLRFTEILELAFMTECEQVDLQNFLNIFNSQVIAFSFQNAIRNQTNQALISRAARIQRRSLAVREMAKRPAIYVYMCRNAIFQSSHSILDPCNMQ